MVYCFGDVKNRIDPLFGYRFRPHRQSNQWERHNEEAIMLPSKDKQGLFSLEWVRENIFYDPNSGHMLWRKIKGQRKPLVSILGSSSNGYKMIILEGRTFLQHRLAWFYMTGSWPEHCIDHINQNKSDNRWSNLREATKAQNGMNRNLMVTNTSGYKNVQFHKKTGRWRARFEYNKKAIEVGLFDTPEAAYKACQKKRMELVGEYA